MMPLTKNTPKPLLKINNRAILDYIIELLPVNISEIIIVISYLGDQIIEHVKNRYPNEKISFIWQKKPTGTAKALELAKSALVGKKFLLMFADDLHSKKAIKQCLSYDLAILVKKSDHPERFGVVSIKKPNVPRGTLGEIKNIVEKPEKPESNLVNVGVQVLDSRIFNYKAKKHSNGEYYLTDQINQLARDCPVKAVKTDFWLPIGYPEDLEKAEEILSNVPRGT